jgi:N6-adenosine-specific RNA methylase IME4
MSKKYQIIYADPPWRYDFSKSDSRKIENQYPTMTVEDICALQVPSDVNSILFLWATSPKLLEALKVMEAWGFKYKSQAIWDKQVMGMGYWFRGRHELLLVGVKGKMSPPPQSLRIASVISQKRDRHSAKPIIVREYITSWYPESSKLEMFARVAAEGWDVFGNQIEGSITL